MRCAAVVVIMLTHADFLVGNLFFAVDGMDQRRCWSCDIRDFPVYLY